MQCAQAVMGMLSYLSEEPNAAGARRSSGSTDLRFALSANDLAFVTQFVVLGQSPSAEESERSVLSMAESLVSASVPGKTFLILF